MVHQRDDSGVWQDAAEYGYSSVRYEDGVRKRVFRIVLGDAEQLVTIGRNEVDLSATTMDVDSAKT